MIRCNNIICLTFFTLCLLSPLQSFAAAEWWTIGIYEGPSPLELSPIPSTPSPVLTADDIVDPPAVFVADPFLLTVDDTWYLFFEILNETTEQGDIGYATSDNGLDWTYQQIVLDEPYHLSYPYIFEWQGEYYMVPESFELNSVLLYRAVNFPTDWEFAATLVTGRVYVDPSPFYYSDVWWMFAATESNDTLYLFYADDLAGPWIEHPSSPVVEGDANIARPGGRVLEFDGRLLRITQDDAPTYGNQVRAFEITTLSKVDYAEFEVPESPLLSATGSGWNADGMHHLDAVRLPSGRWLAAVDAKGDPTPYQGTDIGKDNWTLQFFDSEELVGDNGAASNAFDGDAGTIWHTEWLQADPPHPHEIQLYLGDAFEIDGFRYVPRQDGAVNGRIANYEFYISQDGVNWGVAVATGTFANDASTKEIRFAPVTGQFVRLRALSEVNGNPWTSMAELDVFGVAASSTNLPPDGVIDTPPSNVTINVGEALVFSATGRDIDGDLPLSYWWSFGVGSGVADSTLEDPGLIQFDSVGTFTVALTVTDAQGLNDSTPATRTVTVLPTTTASSPVDLSGTIETPGGTEICAMVLASGQYTFSCNPVGVFSLSDLPRETDGTVKRQIFAEGFFPTIDILTDSSNEAVVMTRSGACPSYNTPYDPGVFSDSAGKRINISGRVLLQNSQTPICALVLANGQYMFSCDGSGRYALNIPLDINGQFKLQVYADGFAPTIQTFDELSPANDVRMARAVECQ